MNVPDYQIELTPEILGKLTVHPVAARFPMLDCAAMDDLVDSIRKDGLLFPICVEGNVLVDGRNRLWACHRANVKPDFCRYRPANGPVEKWIFNMNLNRRHLTGQQRAALGIEYLGLLMKPAERQAKTQFKKGQRRGPGRGNKTIRPKGPTVENPAKPSKPENPTRAAVAAVAGVSEKTARVVLEVVDKAPEHFEAVKAGTMTAQEALAAVAPPKPAPPAPPPAPTPPPPAPAKPAKPLNVQEVITARLPAFVDGIARKDYPAVVLLTADTLCVPLTATERKSRERNVLFDALAQAEGSNPDQLSHKAGARIGTALKEIKEGSPEVTPAEIERRAVNYRKNMPQVTLTAGALAKWWARCDVAAPMTDPLHDPRATAADKRNHFIRARGGPEDAKGPPGSAEIVRRDREARAAAAGPQNHAA